MLTQLNPPIPLQTPKGKAWAVALVDYGPQWDLQWITFIHSTGECWTFRNSQIRQEANYTFGLGDPTPVSRPSIANHEDTPAVAAGLNGGQGGNYNSAPNGINVDLLSPRENAC